MATQFGFRIHDLIQAEGSSTWYCSVTWDDKDSTYAEHWDCDLPVFRKFRTGINGTGLFVLGSDNLWHEVVTPNNFRPVKTYAGIRSRLVTFLRNRKPTHWRSLVFKREITNRENR